jgi:uncharacterized protein (TIGR02722 family)
MKKLILVSVIGLSISLLAGCANKSLVSYGDANAIETTNINFGSTDLQKITDQMTESLIRSPVIGTMTANKRPIVFVDTIKNKTSEHIDTESLTDSISTQLLRSGKFRFVDMTKVNSVREQLNYQNEGDLVNPNKAVQFGKQVGAEYMLYGNLASIVKTNADQSDVYYKFTMRLMDLESGLVEWADETEIRKTSSKKLLGW